VRIEPWKKRYEELRVKYLLLQSKYYFLKAKYLAKMAPRPNESTVVSKEKYYLLLSRFKRCRAALLKKIESKL
jgi:hypothetical protein